MRLAIIVSLALTLLGCEGDEANAIRQCGIACQSADAKMFKYSKADGCVCGAAPEAAK